MKKNTKIAVFGGGLWGTVLAQHLCRGGSDRSVRLWEFFPELARELEKTRRHRHIPGFRLDDSVLVTSDLGKAMEGAEVLLFVLPSGHLRQTAKAAARYLGAGRPVIVNASKGIEPETLKTMGEILASEFPRAAAVYTLSGPSFAREVARGIPTRMLLGGPGGARAEAMRRLFDGGALRVAHWPDRKGVELGGSLKNVLAIGCGILDGLKAGANTKAALIVQGMAEMARLIRKSGGRADTIYGLAGLGDLIATGTSPESRNRGFGEKLGSGKTLQEALREIPTVVEGIEAAESAHALALRLKLKAPLLEAIWDAVHAGKAPRVVLKSLGF
ncbi:MAG: NAD(P)-dependent glycerol-3-phosphate dehydrogenase [Elusimicrobia bacterium]|nr:NAD(P)-dependent glycerol-3-phosphate dehydrogenase [Elusimicrobiota bacterium]